MKKVKPRKPHIVARAREAQQIVVFLSEFHLLLSPREWLFVVNIEEKLRNRGDSTYLSRKQINWLRVLDERFYR